MFQISKSVLLVGYFICMLNVNAVHNITNNVGFELLFTSEISEYVNCHCPIYGRLPEWLNGNLIRNGMGRYEMGDTKFSHIFDGFPKLHSFRISANESTLLFSSRFLQTNSYKESLKMNRIHPNLYFDDLEEPMSRVDKLKALFNGPDNTNVNIFDFIGEPVAMSDYWPVYRFDKYSLANVTRVNPPLPGLPTLSNMLPILSTAHPLREYGTGAAITIVSVNSPISLYGSSTNVVRAYSLEKRELIASIPVERASYMHSFAMTKHYVILFADPIFVSFSQIMRHATLVSSIQWQPEKGSSVYVVELKTGKVTKLQTKAAFHLHHANSYEDGENIFIDFVTYSSFEFIAKYKLKYILDPTSRKDIDDGATFIRYNINLKVKSIERVPSGRPQAVSNALDFPVINENFRFKKYCYVYGVVSNADRNDRSNMVIVKKDLCKGKDQIWRLPSHYPTEAVFVPNPRSCSEDDGVLLSVVLDGFKRKSYLLTLDAETMETLAISYLPIHVPFTIHGHFFSV